jgi:hypothetical protein
MPLPGRPRRICLSRFSGLLLSSQDGKVRNGQPAPCGLRAIRGERCRREEWPGESERPPRMDQMADQRSPQVSARTRANTREQSLSDEKKPQLRTVGASIVVVGWNPAPNLCNSAPYEPLRTPAERCGIQPQLPTILPVPPGRGHQPSASDRTPVRFPFEELNPRPQLRIGWHGFTEPNRPREGPRASEVSAGRMLRSVPPTRGR